MLVNVEIFIILDLYLSNQQARRISDDIVFVEQYSCIELSYSKTLLSQFEINKGCLSRSVVNNKVVGCFELLSILTHICYMFEEGLSNLTTFECPNS
jgi:hypothetical protein